jgi:hypothetical protein
MISLLSGHFACPSEYNLQNKSALILSNFCAMGSSPRRGRNLKTQKFQGKTLICRSEASEFNHQGEMSNILTGNELCGGRFSLKSDKKERTPAG